jgi:methylglutaconyl-CoA hydratase
VEEGSAVEKALAFAGELLKSSPASMRATKQLLRAQGREQLDRELAAAAEANAQMRMTEDFAEGLAAFLAKRKPRWSSSFR